MASSYALPPNGRYPNHEHLEHDDPGGQSHTAGLAINGIDITNSDRIRFSTSFHALEDDTHHAHQHKAHKPLSAKSSKQQRDGEHVGIQEKTVNGFVPVEGQRSRETGQDETGRTSLLSTELMTAFLLVSQLGFAALAVPSSRSALHSHLGSGQPKDIHKLQESVQKAELLSHQGSAGELDAFIAVLAMAAVTLLLHGITQLFYSPEPTTSAAGYASPRMPTHSTKPNASPATTSGRYRLRSTATITAGIILPLFAAVKLGGWRASMILLASHAAGISQPPKQTQNHSTIAVLSALGIACITDLLDLTAHSHSMDTVLGYVAIAAAITLVPFPSKVVQAGPPSHISNNQPAPMSPSVAPWSTSTRPPDNTLRADDSRPALSGAALLALLAAAAVVTSGQIPQPPIHRMALAMASITATLLAMRLASAGSLQSSTGIGFLAGMLSLALAGMLTISGDTWVKTIGNSLLTSLHIGAVMMRIASRRTTRIPTRTSTKLHRQHTSDHISGFTAYILQRTEPGSLLNSILQEKDSRRIAYFTCLNFGFMLVQGLYGYLSGSLGLLSDTVHMFFDCLGLIVGLGAAIASRWPPSKDRPFGWGKLNTLAGFGNGVFLMLVSVEFVWEAIEGILEGRELRRVKELFVVSTLGLVVNLVGLFAFGHAHAGHDHGHGHGHEGHDHSHNENMHGIFLHVAADAGGSLAVIVSTALTLWSPWYLWDPLATIVIAVLIFAAAVPLVAASGQKLLLVVPEDTEHVIKGFLQEVGEVRGVISYSEPRFWIIDECESPTQHEHHEHTHHDSQEQHHHAHRHHSHRHPDPVLHTQDDCGHHRSEGHQHSHPHEHEHHEHEHSHPQSHPHSPAPRITGSLHVTVVQQASLEDVRERVQDLALTKGMNVTIQVQYADIMRDPT